MFIIKKNKRGSNIIINKSFDCSVFFLELFQEIDNNKLCKLEIIFSEISQNFDFGFDFLSVYDFIPNFVKFIGFGQVMEEFTFLFYERGEDKLIAKKMEINKIKLIYNTEEIKMIFSIDELNELILNLVNDLEDVVYSNFILEKENCFDVWKEKIVTTLS